MPLLLRMMWSLVLAAALAGCAHTPDAWLRTYGLPAEPDPGALVVCTSFACAGTAQVSLSAEEWDRVRALFMPRPEDAASERRVAARAVGLLEELVGPKAGTAGDRPRDDVGGDDSGQLDCIAEAANSTMYLLLLEREGLLAFHWVATPAGRGLLIFMPHSTAVLEETANGEEHAVDSWYGSNGDPAWVWPLAAWMRRDADGEETGAMLARADRRKP